MMVKNILILVEGPEDRHVISRILHANEIEFKDGKGNVHQHTFDDKGVEFEIVVRDEGSVDELLEVMATSAGNISDTHVAYVLDADNDIASRWTQIKDRLSRLGYKHIPASLDETGTVIVEQSDPGKSLLPRLGIWVMPNNRDIGALEHFIESLISERGEESLWQRAVNCVDSIPNELVLFGDSYQKAYVHTWLAWQETPGTPLGLAVARKYLEPQSDGAMSFVDWIKRLAQ